MTGGIAKFRMTLNQCFSTWVRTILYWVPRKYYKYLVSFTFFQIFINVAEVPKFDKSLKTADLDESTPNKSMVLIF